MIGASPSRSAIAASRTSNRKSAWRWFSSGPWQAKHLPAKTGLMSRLKLTGKSSAHVVRIVQIASNKGMQRDMALIDPPCSTYGPR
jgi:hypothetical protein